MWDISIKGDLVEILLGFFNVEACYLQEQAILAMYSYSAVSGVIGKFLSLPVYTEVVVTNVP